MPTRSLTSLLGALLVLTIAAAAASAQAAADPVSSGPSLGLIVDGPVPASLLSSPRDEGASPPLAIRLTARWDAIEQQHDVFDWSVIEPTIKRLHGAGHRITLCLTGSNPLYLDDGAPPSPLVDGALDAWLRFVRSAVRASAEQVAVYEIWDGPARVDETTGQHRFDPEIYAFLLKQTALVMRAEARAAGVEMAVAQGALEAGALEWQRSLWEQDAAAYIDVLPLRVWVDDAGPELDALLSTLYAEAVRHPPAPAIWVYLEPRGSASGWAPARSAVEALASGASQALARLPAETEPAEQLARWTLSTQRTLTRGFAPAPMGELALIDDDGQRVAGARPLGRFLSGEELTSLIVYDASPALGQREQVRLVVDSRRVRNGRTIDPLGGRLLRTAAQPLPGDDSRRVLRVPVTEHPMLLLFQKAVVTPGFELPPEELEVERARGLTAEEIIARHQQVQKFQDDALERWIARGRLDYHFKLSQGGSTVDVGIESNYFWERGGQLEWEQTDYYINGNRIRWKKIPELPLIQPEKVMTVPLELTLDKTYAYRLIGEARVDGRETYLLGFQPVDADTGVSLYQGRVWIDQQNFQRLKASVVQTNLEAPVISNEERNRYRPHAGSDGQEHWMLSELDGQQIWTAGGRSFVVLRELAFFEFRFNPPQREFEERRERAYASSNQMLRDTEQGLRYLERQDDGTRMVKEGIDSSQWFAAAGAFKDSATAGVTPLAGFNYFNYDVGGRNVQINALFGGVLAFFTASKPDLFGRKIDATVEATALAIEFEDKLFVGPDESLAERLDNQPQNLSLRLGVPLGQFFKVNLIGNLTHRGFTSNEDAQDVLAALNSQRQLIDPTEMPWSHLVPADHLQTTGRLELEFNRRGYAVIATGSRSNRSDWEEFGLFDPDPAPGDPSFLTFAGGDPRDPASYLPVDPQPLRDSFTRWSLSAFKEWYLPKFQKLRAEVNYLDGSDLDRFSQYRFSFFGDQRLNGFSGSGVRFDNGLILRTGYAFNLFEVIRFDAALETARVESESSGVGSQSFTGIGLSGNVVGPWKTVISLSYGISLDADIPALESEQEFLLLVLKLF